MRKVSTYDLESKQEKIRSFDVNNTISKEGLFNLPFSARESEVVLIPVPWDVTCSFRSGTSKAPQAIYEASSQIDLYHPLYPDAWKSGFYMFPPPASIMALNSELAPKAREAMELLRTHPNALHPKYQKLIQEVNHHSLELNRLIEEHADELLLQGKILGLVGGEHSVSYGLIKALSSYHKEFAIVQLDAHADFRPAYCGFTFSHASIMYNVWRQIPQVSQFLLIGLRDICHQEAELIHKEKRIVPFFARDIHKKLSRGHPFHSIICPFIDQLPQHVYLSFDIDVLDPAYCPKTGTPVPFGLTPQQCMEIVEAIVESGRIIIGFDLVEVGAETGEDYDAIIASHILFQLCVWTVVSQHKLPENANP